MAPSADRSRSPWLRVATTCMVLTACGGIARDAGESAGGVPGQDPDNAADAGETPCDGLLSPSSVEPFCRSDPNVCEHVRTNIDEAYTFSVFLEDGDLAVHACIFKRLRDLGLEVEILADHGGLGAIGPYRDIEPVLYLAAVQSYSVGCIDERCLHCHELTPEVCATDGFCLVVSGARWTSEECYEPSVPVGCHPRGYGCGAMMVAMLDPEGRCWRFPSTCVPAGWSTLDGSDCPGADGRAPQCGL